MSSLKELSQEERDIKALLKKEKIDFVFENEEGRMGNIIKGF